jgi:hypothetical protein
MAQSISGEARSLSIGDIVALLLCLVCGVWSFHVIATLAFRVSALLMTAIG